MTLCLQRATTKSFTMTTAASKQSPSPSKDGPSLVNVILLYSTLIGMGVIVGFSGFYFQFNERCVTLLHKAEDRFNSSKIEWHAKHQEAVAEKDECLSPLQDLQGKLDAQSSLAEQHQELKERHEKTIANLAAMQKSNMKNTEIRKKLNEEIAQLKSDVESTKQQLSAAVQDKDQVKNLEARLKSTMDNLAAKTMEMQQLKASKDKQCESSSESSKQLESDLTNVQKFVQNRAERMCRMEYGKGPFIIQFNVKFPGEAQQESFQVQLANLSEMPHTIFVLMELIHLKAYEGTVIKAGDKTLEAGNLADADNAVAVKLLDRLVKYGYEKPVAFREHSELFKHEEFTIGFVEAGPALSINTADNTKERGPEGRDDACFGKVVSGFETITRIQDANGSAIELVSVERVR